MSRCLLVSVTLVLVLQLEFVDLHAIRYSRPGADSHAALRDSWKKNRQEFDGLGRPRVRPLQDRRLPGMSEKTKVEIEQRYQRALHKNSRFERASMIEQHRAETQEREAKILWESAQSFAKVTTRLSRSWSTPPPVARSSVMPLIAQILLLLCLPESCCLPAAVLLCLPTCPPAAVGITRS